MYWASVVLTSARVTLASALLMVIWPLPLKSPPRVVSMLRSAYLSRCMSWMYQVSATVLPLQPLPFLAAWSMHPFCEPKAVEVCLPV